MRDFPTQHLAHIRCARMDALLYPSPQCDFHVYYCIELDLERFAVDGEEATARTISLGHLPLNGSPDWRKISGTYEYGKDEIRGTWRMRNQWLPVDLPHLTLHYLGGRDFKVDCELHFDMEVWDDCYQNFDFKFSCEAEFTGYRNQKSLFEPEIDLSTREKVRCFLSEHIEMSAYKNLSVDDVFVSMDPTPMG